MSAADAPAPRAPKSGPDKPSPRAAAPRRGRPPLIAALRILLPGFAVAVILLVIGWAVVGAVRGPQRDAAAPPLALMSPRLVGQDDKRRAFVITADNAVREPGAARRIHLTRPVLARDENGPAALHVKAASGVYDEAAGRLELSGGVEVSGARGHFTTPATVYDTRTGSIVGSGAVQAAGQAGQLQAGSFSVKDNGRSVVYKGGVHTRLNAK